MAKSKSLMNDIELNLDNVLEKIYITIFKLSPNILKCNLKYNTMM